MNLKKITALALAVVCFVGVTPTGNYAAPTPVGGVVTSDLIDGNEDVKDVLEAIDVNENEKNSLKGSPVLSGEAWYDDRGKLIQGHGGNIITYEGRYYWVGENKVANGANFGGISLYSSDNLADWKYENDIITNSTKAPKFKNNGKDGVYGDDDLIPYGRETLGKCTIERPKLIYSPKIDKFILYAHWENGSDYTESYLLVATCDTINGDYEVLGLYHPCGNRSLDFNIFVDEVNNKAYIIAANGWTLYVYPLNEDYTDVVVKDSYAIYADVGREAPALVKAGDYYVLITSGQSGWYPNQGNYSYTKDITDPKSWSDLYMVGNNTTWYSQPTNIAIIKDREGNDQYVYMGDRWNPKALYTSTYVWLPLDIKENETKDGVIVNLDYESEWYLDTEKGTIEVPTNYLVSEGKKCTASHGANSAHLALDGIISNVNRWGDSSNYFAPGSVPFTWTVDLEVVYELSRIDISFRTWNGSESYHQYTVEGSNDGENWSVMVDATNNGTVGFKSHDLRDNNYRFVRINCSNVYNVHNNNEAHWAAGLVEVHVYSSAPAVVSCHSKKAYEGNGTIIGDNINAYKVYFRGLPSGGANRLVYNANGKKYDTYKLDGVIGPDGEKVYLVLLDSDADANGLSNYDNFTVVEEKEYNVILGDINGDKVVDIRDTIAMLRRIKDDTTPFAKEEIIKYNLDGDSDVDFDDVNAIKDYILRKTKYKLALEK